MLLNMCNKRNLKANTGILRLKVSNKVENMNLFMTSAAWGHSPRRTPAIFHHPYKRVSDVVDQPYWGT